VNIKKETGVLLLVILLIILFFIVLMAGLYFQKEITNEIIFLCFVAWSLKNICRFVVWITDYKR